MVTKNKAACPQCGEIRYVEITASPYTDKYMPCQRCGYGSDPQSNKTDLVELRKRIELHRSFERPFVMALIDDLFKLVTSSDHAVNGILHYGHPYDECPVRQPLQTATGVAALIEEARMTGYRDGYEKGFKFGREQGAVEQVESKPVTATVQVMIEDARTVAYRDGYETGLKEQVTLFLSNRADVDKGIDADYKFLRDVKDEIARARKKFPGPNAVHAAMIEEVGEVAKALMYEPWSNVYSECVQVAAMALRLAREGDFTMQDFRWNGPLHQKGKRYLRDEDIMPNHQPPLAKCVSCGVRYDSRVGTSSFSECDSCVEMGKRQ